MKARFYFDVAFKAGKKTDAEGMASALDNVIKAGMTVLGDCWGDYRGKPKVGEVFVLDTEAAAEHAEKLDYLIDGQEDELGESLVPVREFLRKLARKK
jgi:hypothetical protein